MGAKHIPDKNKGQRKICHLKQKIISVKTKYGTVSSEFPVETLICNQETNPLLSITLTAYLDGGLIIEWPDILPPN